MFIKQVRLVFIFFRASLSPGRLGVEPGFTESHSRQIVIAVIMDTPNRMRKVVERLIDRRGEAHEAAVSG